jgi:hypothetical protein
MSHVVGTRTVLTCRIVERFDGAFCPTRFSPSTPSVCSTSPLAEATGFSGGLR